MTEDPLTAIETFSLIAEAIALLERHRLIGRPVAELRELVISRGRSGYVALHSCVLILAIRHQREAGFAGLEP
jgi:plasmid stabilization system protein ParE